MLSIKSRNLTNHMSNVISLDAVFASYI